MHTLFTDLLINKDLFKLNDLFTVSDDDILDELIEIINILSEIISCPDYINNRDYQKIVEIFITRITTAIRDAESTENYIETLVNFLKSCLNYNQRPSQTGELPSHSKISLDILSCLFLIGNCKKKEVMKIVLPVTVQFLHIKNKILQRRMVSHLSLVATHNCPILFQQIDTIIFSIISGNYPLCQVFIQIYETTKDHIKDYTLVFISLLPLCEPSDKLYLLKVLEAIANHKPSRLQLFISQICDNLTTELTYIATLQVILGIAKKKPELLSKYIPKILQITDYNPRAINITAKILSALGKLNRSIAQEALKFIFVHSLNLDRKNQNLLVRETLFLYSHYPDLCIDEMFEEAENFNKSNSPVSTTISNVSVTDGLHKTKLNSNQLCSSTNTSSVELTPSWMKNRNGTYFKYSIASNTIVQSTSFTTRVRNSLYQIFTRKRSNLTRSPEHSFDPVEVNRVNYSIVTVIKNNNTSIQTSNYVSENTFEEYLKVDILQKFCNKHLNNIKTYMDKIAVSLPPPINYTVDDTKSKRLAKLSFGCENQSTNCLHDQHLFIMYTQYPDIWIHLMYLDIQASSTSALSTSDPLISALKNCWDSLKYDSRTFTILMTSAFPSAKDQQNLLNELHNFGYFDLFDHCNLNDSGKRWCCILCNRPNQVSKFIQCKTPLIEGKLLEKNGEMKSFKRWKKRYFTLYRSHLSYKNKKNGPEKTPFCIYEINNLKVFRNDRNKPKAFEIATERGIITLKPKRGINADKWAQYLSVIVAHTRSKYIEK